MKRLAGNMLALVAGDFGSRLLGFVVTVYLARVLETSGFGIVNIGLSVLGYAMLIVSPGVQFLETRNVAAGQERVNLVLSLRLILALIVTLLAAGISVFVVKDIAVRLTVILFVCSTVPLALFLDWYYAGKEEFPLVSGAKLLMYLVYLVIVLLAVQTPGDITLVPVSFAAGNMAAAATLLVLFKRRGGELRFIPDVAGFIKILRENIPVGVSMFLAQSAINLPPILLGWLVSTSDAGVFSAGMKIIFLLLIADRVLHTLLLPVATRHYAGKRDEAPELFSLVTKWVTMVALPISILGMVFASPIIQLVFGAGYSEAALVLKILMAFFFFTLLNTICICVLLGSGNERSYSSTMLAGSAITVMLILLGTISAGMVGAAAGIVVGEIVTVGLMMSKVGSVAATHLPKHLIKPVIAGVVMVGVLLMLQSWNPFLWGVISLGAYVFALGVLGTFNRTEIKYVMGRFV